MRNSHTEKRGCETRPVVSKKMIVAALRRLGLSNGDSVLVHSSLSSFGYVEGGAATVIEALLDAVGPDGNVMVPTLTGTKDDGPDNPPIFDVRRTPCWTGRIPATFMMREEAVRSLHPTHSVAVIGPKAELLIRDHHLAQFPCSEGTPYLRLARMGGYILLVGVGQSSNTTLHTVEELARVPYHLQSRPTTSTVIDYNGNRMQVTGYLHDWGTPRRFEIIDVELKERGIMTVGQVGNATLRLIRAQEMIDLLVPRLRKIPRYLCADAS